MKQSWQQISEYRDTEAAEREWQKTHNAKVEADGAASCAGRASNDGLCHGADNGERP